MSDARLAILLVALGGGALLISAALTMLVIPAAKRIGFVDRPSGHKSHREPTPYGGGIAIFIAAWLPLALVILLTSWLTPEQIAAWFGDGLRPYIDGLVEQQPRGLAILIGGALLHGLGLVDDRRALGPYPKLLIMILVGLLVAQWGGIRLLDAAGPTVATVVTVAWLLVIINAMNFLDNMDGLSAGIAAICLVFVVWCGALAGQVFVPALGCVFLGSVLGFLIFNFPPAKVFMGDAGSLLVGYMLAISSIMTTYYDPDSSRSWYALAMPLAILAVPLYDFVTVLTIRLREGRHPMQGDQRHFSHRLVDHGLSRRGAVLTIYIATAATGLCATLLTHATLRETITVSAIVLLVLTIIAILERPVDQAE